jgi:mycothiol synthase
LITRYSHLNPDQQNKVLALIASATDVDGIPPVAEHVLLHLRHGGDKEDFHLLAEEKGEVLGYAHLDLTDEVEGPSAELVVSPAHRSKGIGDQLIASVKSYAGEKLRLWSHGDLPGAKNLAEKNGLKHSRTVIQMRRSLTDPIPEIDSKIPIRSFLPGIDNESWLQLNNEAFQGHPEQSNWSDRDLAIRTKEDWFNPKGFLIAEINGELAGFCWTKVHGGHTHKHSDGESEHDHDPIGEIYIMGVNPKFQGRGIGKAVTIAGLKHLRYEGIFSAMLYVDADNTGAINLYTSLGFKEWGRDVLYRYSLTQ